MLAAAAGCGRGPPSPGATSTIPESEAPAPELAGGPPASDSPPPASSSPASSSPATLAQDAGTTAKTLDAQPSAPAPEARPATAVAEIPDPLQRLNRPLFKVDQAIHHTSLAKSASSVKPPKPPKVVRVGLANALSNMDEPTNIANQVLQRRPGRAIRTVARFVINSTLGLGGLIDVARRFGFEPSHADFGQTLASYGVGPGAYLYVPIRGPTNVRDVVGAVADSYFWPLHWVRVAWFAQPTVVVARLEAEPKTDEGFRYAAAEPVPAPPPVDPYVAARRAYAMNRQAEIRGVQASPVQATTGPVLAGAPPSTTVPRAPRRVTLQLISTRQPIQNPLP